MTATATRRGTREGTDSSAWTPRPASRISGSSGCRASHAKRSDAQE